MPYRSETVEIEHEREAQLATHEDWEPTLQDYARVVWGGRWLIVTLVALATTAALGASVTIPKTFSAQTTIMPFEQDRGGSLSSALAGSLGGRLGIENSSDKLVAVLQSRRVAGMVVDELGLEAALAQATGKKPTRDEAIEAVQKRIVKVSGPGRGVITVRAQWRDPEMAAAIANATVSSAGRFLNERSISMNFQILDEAVPPRKPIGPRMLLNMVLAGILSGFAALVVVFVREYVKSLREHRSFNGRPASNGYENG
ncbi:MAG: Wzz/FepE/Etk N-terminal domain-containing protein [Nitrospirota bacterium]